MKPYDVGLICGRFQTFHKGHEKLVETALIINRAELPISATMVRERMVKDDRKGWMELVNPKLHKMYDQLRAELMSVDFYKETQNGTVN